jgi:acetyl-CoA carboxylase biotin carboxyl carrier protein
MSDKPTDADADDPQVRRVRHLVKLMRRFDLTAIDLDDAQTKIRLRRRGAEVLATPAHIPAAMTAPTTPPVHHPPASTAPPTVSTPAGVFIESPMVGTFYASPSPDAPPFVQVGSVVRQDSTVCVIEAMKVFTDIPAGVGGTIVEVLVKNGQAVEFGQPLFRVEP